MSAPSPNLQRRMNNTGNIIDAQKHLLPGLYNRYPKDYLDFDTYNGLVTNKPWIEPSEITSWRQQSLQSPVITGGDKILVICVDFSDKPASVSTSAIYNRLFDTTGNTFRNYYTEVSNGLYVPDGIVIGWYRAPQTYAYYRDSPGCNYGRGAYPHNVNRLFEDTLDLINNDPSITDTILSGLDIDGNGYLFRVIIVHAGGEASHIGDCNEIWAHANIIPSKEVKGKIFSTFAITSEYIDTPTDIQRSGPDCHEFGHLLGLQDLYDDSGNSIVGIWSLMSTGEWGIADDGIIPTHLDAWSKSLLGWITSNINQTGTVSIGNIENYYIAYIYTTPNPGEYFMIENRQKIGFDRDLPGSGLLIWHINENKDQSSDINCRKVSLIQADNRRDLENKINPGDADDPYPGEINNRLFNGTSSPNSLLCDGTNPYLEINNISDSATIMSMTAAFTRGNVSISSVPSGARIWIDDIDQLTYTPKEIIGIPLGNHTCTLRLAGYQDLTGNFTVVGGITTEISATLVINLPNTGNASFTSSPTGTRIWIDSIDKGVNTPNTISGLSTGSHNYILKLAGYIDATGTFSVTSGSTTTVPLVTLAPATGSASFTSSPSGARIWIDSIDTGLNTPNTISGLVKGSNHTYRLTLTGYQGEIGTFSIGSGGVTTEISATLAINLPNTGNAYFTSIPSGAGIWIDNINQPDYTPMQINGIPLGTHTFRLTLTGYQDATGTFSIGYEGITTEISRTLAINAANTGSVSLASYPSRARIWIDNIDTGLNTPNTISGLVEGSHTFKLTIEGYQDFVETFLIGSGSTTIIPTANLAVQYSDPAMDSFVRGSLLFIGIIVSLNWLYNEYKKQRFEAKTRKPLVQTNLMKYG